MIFVAGQGRSLAVRLSDGEGAAKVILESMLGARLHAESGDFILAPHDFAIFKQKLDRLGKTAGREMDDTAWVAIESYNKLIELNERAKSGELNNEVEPHLQELIKTRMWADQIADARFCLRHLRAGDFSEMGSGKTLVLLATLAALRRAGMARYALVICTNNVKATWLRQVSQHTYMTAVDLGNGRGQLMRRIHRYESNRSDICITHYEALRDDGFKRALISLPFDFVVCDEAHAFKNLTSSRSKSLIDTLDRLRSSGGLVEAEVDVGDGVTLTAILPAGVKPGDTVEFW